MVVGAAPRLLSALDREPHSATRGSFDREHWGWKFRDWPRGMLQNSIFPVAMLWRHPLPGSPYAGSPRVLEWVQLAMQTMMARQRPNGAVDAFAPNDQDPGVSLMAVYNITEALRIVRAHVSGELADQVAAMTRRACDFAFDRDESHGFVSNHWALFALAYQNAGSILDDARLTARGDEIIDRIRAEQSPEGWYREYEGPDPGYESLGIYYLAKYWTRAPSDRLLDSLTRSVAFYSHFVHPDGGVGGVYGSRHTSLYFPGGFELLADRVPMAHAIASFMAEHLGRGNSVTPAVTDVENLSPLLASYLDAAAHVVTADGDRVASDGRLLPAFALAGARDFSHAGIRVFGSPRYYAVWHGGKGGVCRIFDRAARAVVHEDAGYVIRSGSRRWITQLIGASSATFEDATSCVSSGVCTEWRQQVPTPFNFLLLRLLNLTVFRSPRLGNVVRNWIVKQLILTKVEGPFRFHRVVRFEETAAHFDDTIERTGAAVAEEVSWSSRLTGIHMGSSKYFHPSDLVASFGDERENHAPALNREGRLKRAFSVRLGWLVACGAALAGTVGRAAAQSPPPLVIRGVTIVDVATGELHPSQTIGLAAGRIVSVGEARAAPQDARLARARVIDGRGLFAIPGLWDMHVEMALRLSPATPIVSNPDFFFPLFLAWGVTGVRDVAGDVDVVRRWRDDVARGVRSGPRVAFTGMKIGYGGEGSPTVRVDSPPVLRDLLASLKRAGASDAYVRSLPASFYATLGSAARENGLSFGGLISPTVTLADAVRAGQHSISHFDGLLIAATDDERAVRRMIDIAERRPRWARLLWKVGVWKRIDHVGAYVVGRRSAARERDLIELLVRHRVYQVPTVRLLASLSRASDSALRLPPEPLGVRRPRRPWNGWAAEPVAATHPLALVERARRRLLVAMAVAGVPILAGSDTPNAYAAPGMSLHDELELLVASGLRPIEALRAATRAPGEFLAAADSIGAIAPGYVADLVLLTANPLVDVRHTRRIGGVITAGRYYGRSALDSLIVSGRRAAEPAALYWKLNPEDR
jgi:hypothetical protein